MIDKRLFTDAAIIAGCSAQKINTDNPVAALMLYQGGAIPLLREYTRDIPELISRIFILSAEHGLLSAKDPIKTYDRKLTTERAVELRPQVGNALIERIIAPLSPRHIFIVLEPLYMVLIADLFASTSRPDIYWEPEYEKAVSLFERFFRERLEKTDGGS